MKFFKEIPPNEKINTYIHLVAFIGALFGCGYLLNSALSEKNIPKLVLFLIYSISTIGLFILSSLYHANNTPKKHFFMKLDHMGIYLKIAGNYTPYAVLFLPAREGNLILFTVWSLAILGFIIELFQKNDKRLNSYIVYIIMASSILLAVNSFISRMPNPGLLFISAGFISYLIGFYFYYNESRYKWGHEIWHALVVIGSFSHFFPLAIYQT